jgi:hypothetical protein
MFIAGRQETYAVPTGLSFISPAFPSTHVLGSKMPSLRDSSYALPKKLSEQHWL